MYHTCPLKVLTLVGISSFPRGFILWPSRGELGREKIISTLKRPEWGCDNAELLVPNGIPRRPCAHVHACSAKSTR